MTPKRIQRQRTKGWRMPEGAVYVGRPSRWGNPYGLGHHGRRQEMFRDHVVYLFRSWATARARRDPTWLAPLRGKDLACFCALNLPCHADVLLELANA